MKGVFTMLDRKVKELINRQINEELYSAYLYLAFASRFAENNLDGFAKWYRAQADEEKNHAMIFIRYLEENNESVSYTPVGAPTYNASKPADFFLAALRHEQYITGLINKIYTAAMELNDYRTVNFINGFICEQFEEEKNAEKMINDYDLFGSDPTMLYCLDKKAAKRGCPEPDALPTAV